MRQEKISKSLMDLILLAVSVAASTLIIAVFRAKGGFLGSIIGFTVILMLIYWLREIRKIFVEEKPKEVESDHEWLHDLIEVEDSITLVARVPGPPDKVKVKINDETLEIRGGGNFLKRLQVPRDSKILEKSYVNGVLQVKLKRTRVEAKKIT